MVVLDGEVSNSTKSEKFKERFPDRFFEMYIAEQNMAGAALGLDIRGKTSVIYDMGESFPIGGCDLSRDWRRFDLTHSKTSEGMADFSKDWNSLIKEP